MEIERVQARIRDLKIADEINHHLYMSHLGFLEFQEENELVTLADYGELRVVIDEGEQSRQLLWDAYRTMQGLVRRTEAIAADMRLFFLRCGAAGPGQ